MAKKKLEPIFVYNKQQFLDWAYKMMVLNPNWCKELPVIEIVNFLYDNIIYIDGNPIAPIIIQHRHQEKSWAIRTSYMQLIKNAFPDIDFDRTITNFHQFHEGFEQKGTAFNFHRPEFEELYKAATINHKIDSLMSLEDCWNLGVYGDFNPKKSISNNDKLFEYWRTNAINLFDRLCSYLVKQLDVYDKGICYKVPSVQLTEEYKRLYSKANTTPKTDIAIISDKNNIKISLKRNGGQISSGNKKSLLLSLKKANIDNDPKIAGLIQQIENLEEPEVKGMTMGILEKENPELYKQIKEEIFATYHEILWNQLLMQYPEFCKRFIELELSGSYKFGPDSIGCANMILNYSKDYQIIDLMNISDYAQHLVNENKIKLSVSSKPSGNYYKIEVHFHFSIV